MLHTLLSRFSPREIIADYSMLTLDGRTLRVDVDGPEPVVAAFRFIDEINPPVGELLAATPGLIENYLEPWMAAPFTISIILLADQICSTTLEIEFCKTVSLVTGEQQQVSLKGLGVSSYFPE